MTAASQAVSLIRDRLPGAAIQQAVDVARALEHELAGRSQHGHEYRALRGLRTDIEALGDEAVAALESLAAANDAVTSLRLDGDPTDSALVAINAALRAGVDRDRLDEAIRTARFR